MKLQQLHSCPIKWGNIPSFDERSKFCQLCTKKIYDFENASDQEIAEVLKSEPSVCAKVPVSRLTESITPFQMVLLAMVICFSGTLFKVDFAFGQEELNKQELIQSNEDIWKITGEVRDSTNAESLIGVTITMVGLEQSVVTDFEGRYSIEVPNNLDSVTIEISYFGYKKTSLKVKKEELVELDPIRLVDEWDDTKDIMIGVIISIDPDSGFEKNSLEDLFQREKYLTGF